jgi:hypothetical protein
MFTKFHVCPMKVIDFDHVDKPYFSDALWVAKNLGLNNLMAFYEHYNIHLVQKFYATFVFCKKEDIPVTWMTKNKGYESTCIDFAELLGHNFKGENDPCGKRIHIHGQNDWKRLNDWTKCHFASTLWHLAPHLSQECISKCRKLRFYMWIFDGEYLCQHQDQEVTYDS